MCPPFPRPPALVAKGIRGSLRANRSVVGSVESNWDQNRAPGGGCLHPSSVCSHAHVALGGRDPGSPGSGLGQQPPRLSTGPAGWGGVGRPPPPPPAPGRPCVPGPPHAGRVSKRGAQARFPGDGAVCPAVVLKAPASCGALGNPMCRVRQASPTFPPPSLRGQLTRALPTACMQDSDPTPPQPCLGHRAGSAPESEVGAGGGGCCPGGLVLAGWACNKILARKRGPPPPQPVHREGLCCAVLSL